jgi:RimJ/RimL family protein N-acetyltransferase
MLIHRLKNQTSTLQKIIFGSLLLCSVVAFSSYYLWHKTDSDVVAQKAPDEIRGSVITLKTIKEEDYMTLYHMFSNDTRKGLEFPAVISFGYMIAYLRDMESRSKEHSGVVYAVWDNKDNLPVGTVEIRGHDPKDPGFQKQLGQLGCWLNENYRGQGRIQEAIKLIAKAYFKQNPNETSFIGWARTWNQRSYNALKKAGLVDDTYIYHNGKPCYYQLKMYKS